MNETSFQLVPFVGRFHPMLVHLPIGFLLLLGCLELVARRPGFKHLASASGVILWLCVPVTIGSALSGWLLAGAGDYSPLLLTQHRWAGVCVAALSIAMLVLHQRGQTGLYRALLAATVILVGVTGHLGGSLTHGSDYLAKFAPGPLRGLLGGNSQSDPTPGDGTAFGDAVGPLLKRYCVSCHGPEKSKAGLRMDSFEALMKGSENGPILVAGKSVESEMIKRSLLAEEHDDHMPPAGKPQPTADEVAVLAWWIDAGAPRDKTLAELNPPEAIVRTVNAFKR